MRIDPCSHVIDYYNRTLTDDEMKQFESHLGSCSACRQEIDELTQLTEDLPYLAEEMEIPNGMKARILNNIYQQDSAEVDLVKELEPQKVIDIKQQSGKRKFLVPTVAAALFLSLVTNVYLYNENTQYSKSEELQPMSQATLFPPDEKGNGIAIASLLTENGQNAILLQASNLPKLESDEVYQVWVIEGEQPYPAGAFQTNDAGQGTLRFSLKELKGNWDTIAITVEQEPNLPLPQGELVLAGDI